MSAAWYLGAPEIACALAIDLALGDPPWLPHPVRLIGSAIARGESILRTGNSQSDLIRGAILTSAVVAGAAAAAWIAIGAAGSVHPMLGALVAIAIAWTTLALRGLDSAATAVEDALAAGDLDGARRAIPALAGRDPEALDSRGMILAAVESVAENASDGVIAPLLFLFVGGPCAAIGYKAINTLDSMIGYRDDRYLYFGRAAARLDDAANWIPARLSALCIAGAAQLRHGRGRAALDAALGDAGRHQSPNAGWPEAAMAGAIGIQLGGDAVYAGEVEHRAVLGRDERPPVVADIADARAILRIAALIALVSIAAARAIAMMP